IDCMIEQEERRRFHPTPFQKRATIVSYVVHLLAGGGRVPAKDIIGHLCSEKSAPIADSESVGHPGKSTFSDNGVTGYPSARTAANPSRTPFVISLRVALSRDSFPQSSPAR